MEFNKMMDWVIKLHQIRQLVNRLYCWVAFSNNLDGLQMREQHKIFQGVTNRMYCVLNGVEYYIRNGHSVI